MTGAATIGALRVTLGADSAQFEKGLKDASSAMSSWAKQVSAIAAGIGLEKIVEKVAGAIAHAMKQGVEEADKMGKMAQSIGIPVEELSRLKHAADLSDVSLDELGKSVGRLSRNMMTVASGTEGEAAKAFEALHISVKNSDGTLKSSSQVMTEIAGKFEKMQDGAGKTALAMMIFGRSGANLIPMLNSGAAGMKEMMEEADQLGLVIDNKTAKAAEMFNDNLTRLGKVKDGIITQVTARLVPALASLSQIFIDAAKNSGLLDTAATVLTATIRSLLTAGVVAAVAFKALGQLLSSVATALLLVAKGEFSKALDALGNGVGDWVANTETAFNTIKKIWTATADDLPGISKDVGKKMAAPIIAGADAAKDALEKFLSSTAKRMAALQAEAATIGMTVGEHEKLRVVMQAEAVAKENNITITDALRAKIEAAASAYGAVAQKVDESKKAWERVKSATESVRSSMENAFVDAVTQAKSLRDAINGLLKDLARLAAQTAFRALLGGPDGGGLFGGIAKTLFKGLPGHAQGTSFQVGGGYSGVDSKVVAFRASPGERVNVSKFNDNGGGGVFSPTYNIDARGADQGAVVRIERALDAHARRIDAQDAAMARAERLQRTGVG